MPSVTTSVVCAHQVHNAYFYSFKIFESGKFRIKMLPPSSGPRCVGNGNGDGCITANSLSRHASRASPYYLIKGLRTGFITMGRRPPSASCPAMVCCSVDTRVTLSHQGSICRTVAPVSRCGRSYSWTSAPKRLHHTLCRQPCGRNVLGLQRVIPFEFSRDRRS
jgi:hypothetical protein